MGCCMSVPQDRVYVVEHCGDFKTMLHPGCRCVGCFPIDKIRGSMSKRLQFISMNCVSKTKTNVFVSLQLSVQYEIVQDKLEIAYYKFDDVEAQMKSLVLDSVANFVPKIELDDLFETKDDLSQFVKRNLSEAIESFGYKIVDVLLTSILPDSTVQASMNNISKVRRNRIAAVENAETERIKIVKAAEAQLMQKQLKGEGLARQRQVLVEGLKNSLIDIFPHLGLKHKHVMELILLSQYLDTLKEMGKSNGCKIVFYDEGEDTDDSIKMRTLLTQGNDAVHSQ